jgi:hypothetical protein
MRSFLASLIPILAWTQVDGQQTSQRKSESETYTINQTNFYRISQNSFAHSHPVAFSIGYPSGWTKNEGPAMEGTGDLATTSPRLICWFSSHPGASPSGQIFIERTIPGSTAKKDAEDFFRLRQRFAQEQISTEIKTKAGDSGYMVTSEHEPPSGPRGPSCVLFFHVGKKGHIQVSIWARGTKPELDSLRNLVLETLRFDEG